MTTPEPPSREKITAYLLGTLPEDEAEQVARQLETCPQYESVVEELEDTFDPLVDQLRRPAPLNRYFQEPEFRKALRRAEVICGGPGAGSAQQPKLRDDALRLGQVGEYRLLAELGHGGMGTVYKALHSRLARVVALKLLPHHRMADRRAVARFRREMKAVGRLEHPNIVRATDAGVVEGTHFLVMEYIEGLNLGEVVDHCGPLAVPDACELIRQAALGLECARRHGLVHRDIKPPNLMLSREGNVKILDLGLALIQVDSPGGEGVTGTGQAMGTADYMAPEQVSDTHSVDIRADIYGLGCTLYRLLASRAPFSGPEYKSSFQKMLAHTKTPIPPIRRFRSDVPDELVDVLDRMLAKPPADRYSTPADVAEALVSLAIGSDLRGLLSRAEQGRTMETDTAVPTAEDQTSPIYGTRAGDPSAKTVPKKPGPQRRKPLSIAVGATLLAVCVALGVVVIIRSGDRETIVRAPAQSEVTVLPDGRVTIKPPQAKPEAKPSAPAVPGGEKRLPEKESKQPPSPEKPTPPEQPQTPATKQPPPPGAATKPLAERTGPKPLKPPRVEPLCRMALVTKPAPIKGVQSWTVETRAHRGEVRAAVYSPDGRLLATAGGDGTIRLWNAETAELERMLVGHDARVASLAWTHDGSMLASAGKDRTIRLWDAKAARLLRTLRGHFGEVNAVAFSPNRHILASAGADTMVRLWDLTSGMLRQSHRGHRGEARRVAWSPDGEQLASAGWDSTVIIWDAASNEPVRTLEIETGEVHDVAWSPDGEILAVAVGTLEHDGSGSVQLWNAATGEPLREMPGHRHGDRRVSWSPDGRMLAAAGAPLDGNVRVWDMGATKLIYQCKTPSGPQKTHTLSFSPDGQTLLTAGSRGVVQLWEALSGKPLCTLVVLQDDGFIAVSPEGHVRDLSNVAEQLVYVVQTDQGQQTLTPEEFSKKYGWKNDPSRVEAKR